MGGDAFPNTERLSEPEYKRVCAVITRTLENLQIKFAFPVEVSDKAEICRQRGKEKPFGDVDVIVALDDPEKRVGIVNSVRRSTGPQDEDTVLANGGTYNFLTKERYQVDIKFCKTENLHFLTACKSNNDFGALLGHLLSPLQLKWSEAGLVLKLLINVHGGAVKSDFVLSKECGNICKFLGIPSFTLDGKTRLSCSQIFEVLTRSRVFFPHQYDQKYHIRQRKKRRPVSDTFFNYLESSEDSVMARKRELYRDDAIEETLRKFRNRELGYDEYILVIGQYFNRKEEVRRACESMKCKTVQRRGKNEKFNFYILKSWFPDLDPKMVGRLIVKIKRKHSKGKHPRAAFDEWVQRTEISLLREEAFKCRQELFK